MFGLNKNKTQENILPKDFPSQDWLLDLLLDNSPTAITIFDKNGVYIYTKGRALAGVKHKDGESVGKSIFDMYGSFPEIAENARKALKGEKCTFTVNVHGAWFVTVFVPVKDESGVVEKVVGIATNVTDQKRNEVSLIQAKNELETMVNSLSEPIFVKNRQHAWILLNDAFCKFIGHERSELIDKSDYEFFPKEQADVFWSKDEEVFLSGKENINEEKFTNSNGETKTILTKKSLGISGNGDKVLVGIIHDITESRQAEELIKESEERFRGMYENMSSAVVIYQAIENGADFLIKECNPIAMSLSKMKRSELIGKRMTDVFPGVKEVGLLDVMRRVWQSGKPVNLPSTQYKDDRLSFWMENRIYKMPSGEVVAITEDVSQKKIDEEKILNHNKELEELNRIMTGRELKMVELKNEIREMKKLLDEKSGRAESK